MSTEFPENESSPAPSSGVTPEAATSADDSQCRPAPARRKVGLDMLRSREKPALAVAPPVNNPHVDADVKTDFTDVRRRRSEEEIQESRAENSGSAQSAAGNNPDGKSAGDQASNGNREDRPRKKFRDREKPKDPIREILDNAKVGKVSTIPVDQLSSEAEQEYMDALGELAGLNGLDSLMSGQSMAGLGTELERETKVEGTVIRVSGEDVLLDLGNFLQGVVALRQFEEAPEVGAKIKVMVVRHNTDDDLYEVSLPHQAADIEDWSEIEEGMTVEASVTGHNAGGLECEVCHIRAFMPISQVSLYRVENLEEFVGQKLMAIVTEAKPERRNLVISHKSFAFRQQEAEKKEFMASLKSGEVYDAIVRKIMPFGCFVDLGHGVEGLVHISRLSWGRINHPSEVVSEGDQIRVCLDKIDDAGKLSLSYRDTTLNPWTTVEEKYPIGTVCTGTVTKIMAFGCFVELEPGVEGLIHISELAHNRVVHVSDVVKQGQSVEVKVIDLSMANQKMGLSIKSLTAAPEKDKPAEDENSDGADSGKGKGKGKGRKEEDYTPKPLPKSMRKGSKEPLKGGTGSGDKNSNGSKFGLNW